MQEISQLEGCFKATAHQKAFMKSFAQVTPSQELREHFRRGADISHKHLTVFQDLLSEHDFPRLPTWESEITDLTKAPFSDRLMLFKMLLITNTISIRYGAALSTMMRRDLGLHFARLRTELLKYGEDSMNLLIKHQYLDQFPMAQEKTAATSSV